MPLHSDLLFFTANYHVWLAVFQVTGVDLGVARAPPGDASSCSVSWIHTLYIYYNLHQIFCQCNFELWFCCSVLYMWHLMHVFLSWERDPSSVALLEVSKNYTNKLKNCTENLDQIQRGNHVSSQVTSHQNTDSSQFESIILHCEDMNVFTQDAVGIWIICGDKTLISNS